MIPASDNFIKVMKSAIKKVYIKIEFYDSQMNFIKEFTKQVLQQDSGKISINIDRPVNRSFNFALDNSDGTFTWGEDNLIWIDKRVKVYIGLELSNGQIEYIPQGLFIVSEPSDSNNFDGKKAFITGQDKAFLLTDKRGRFKNQTTIATGTNIATAIKTIAQNAGETMFLFDNNITKTTPYELTYQAGDSKWKAIQELATWGECIVYYDVNGYLRLKTLDLNELQNYSPVWSYKYGDSSERFYAGNARKLDESELANHIYVLGGSGGTATVNYTLKVDDTDPLWANHPYSIQKIGDIIYGHNNFNPDPLITTEAEAKWRAKFELMNRLGYSERVSMQITPNYLHESGDVIEVVDSSNNVSGKYSLRSFDIPLIPDMVGCELLKIRQVISDWNFI